jgi:hypothetical protein
MKMKRTILGVIALGLLVGCSTISVNTDYSVDANFSQFKTFQYQDSNNTVEAKAPLAHQRIVAAIKQGMTSSGMTEVDKNPDVLVSYYGSTDQQLRFNTTYTGVGGWGRSSRYMGMGISSATTTTTTVTEGTLVIDVWDAAKNSMVWRGMATGTLGQNPDRNTAKINSAVERAFRDFPPK